MPLYIYLEDHNLTYCQLCNDVFCWALLSSCRDLMESIFNRPPSISEDTLQYIVFPSPEHACSEASCAALGTRIEAMILELLPKSFLWHRDAFELKMYPYLPHEASPSTYASSSEKKWKLEGRMRVGDSINDEWCVVWLWKELTKTLDIAVR